MKPKHPSFDIRTAVVFALMFALAFQLGAAIRGEAASAASTTYWPNGWNLYKVYLSPAYHGGNNTGCNGYVEDSTTDGAPDIAKEAASGYGTDLRDRHYYVKVAWGISHTAKISDSNAWGADIHIPIHSNAKSQNCGAAASYGGTHVIYQYSSQIAFASDLESAIDGSSPGTGDKICHTPTCSQYSSLGELTQTYAKAAYLEADYHTYSLGVTWLRDRTWQWRIGYGVDMYLGYPRDPLVY